MQDYIRISHLNDYLFCPKSIYFHNVYEDMSHWVYKETTQYAWSHAHRHVDEQSYSNHKHILQSHSICSHKYQLRWVIDVFDTKRWLLRERKKHIKKLYRWYIYQVYAQRICLKEMWYIVHKAYLYSKDDNKKYAIEKPNRHQTDTFFEFLKTCRAFDPLDPAFSQNPRKCGRCIYRDLCDTYLSSRS